jgi:hypothetical protein
MAAGFTFGGFDSGRQLGCIDGIFFLTVRTGDLRIKKVQGSAVKGSEVQGSGSVHNPEPRTFEP